MPQQLQGLIIPIGFLVVFYIFAIRPQKKREQQVREMRDNLRVGDEIITIGGINGKIIKVKEDFITIEVGSSRTKLDMARWSVGSVVNKNESKKSKDEEVDTKEEDK
ncbi:preprotein translocase subunit YajC [Tissierella praeacuta]|uniref:Protein translocase subunit yajC n=1 Tax=Tissierella praeacuta DSM 18095 TaxID=1123404 RepID=A0A1M4ZET2_9FIRM|nr:preprotein translocase subunit YajC [Tissierella praeacuta]HAE91185.1 preprotein translocase subunit YajC [Tissierella sp.]MBU5257426.1 preprotein translocase subunit YajC [Tissierella praeacuta]TCU65368.1 preprotein translocase subunit YajC [Tissierella praeacuta]SHF16511.1 protein translocase subunit yajC [Tissierella praeacuta DSM 18095]SUP01928.1 preprotein translocase subunit YajC [Tissierella praeacuta]